LLFFWLLFVDYFTHLISPDFVRQRLTRFRPAMLPPNTGGQACTRRKGDLGFVVFITARWPLCTSQPQQWLHIARWFALRVSLRSWSFALQITAVGFTRAWPNSQHSNEQQAKINIMKACIVNESDGLTSLFDDVSASKMNKKTNNNLNSSRIWVYKDLNVLNVLKTPQQSNNQGESNRFHESIVYYRLRSFAVTAEGIARIRQQTKVQ
jgi:hypothetical protein